MAAHLRYPKTPFLAGALVPLLLAVAAPARAQVFSPGKLSRSHAALEGAANCTRCHAQRGRVEAARCLQCHKVLGRRVAARRGYHARLGKRRCGQCHQEHRGTGFAIIHWPGGRDAFGHRGVGFELTGKHRSQTCRRCHRPGLLQDPAVRRFSASRRKRTYLGLSASCKTCHKDPHRGRLGGDCRRCHDATSFKGTGAFDHARTRFPLRGAHGRLKCAACHKRAAGESRPRYGGLRFDGCQRCHKDPHREAMTGAGRPCSACHGERSWKTLVYARASHSPRRLPLTGGHRRVPCTRCHGPRAVRSPRAACGGCHRDPHRGRFGNDCQRCHRGGSWSRRVAARGRAAPEALKQARRLGITAAQVRKVGFHDRTRYPLRGGHVAVPCRRCHRKGRGYRRYRGLRFDRCDRCHRDPHGARLSRTRGGQVRRCEACHGSPTRWGWTGFSVKRHEASRFALRGAHRAVPCARCHPASRRGAARFTVPRRGCEACHRDVHGGQFSARAAPGSSPDGKGAPALGCVDCHGQQAFKMLVFDHTRTRFALRGAHRRAACGSCHRKGRGKFVIYRGTRRACGSCHRDPHRGQFVLSGARKDCSACHTPDSFKLPRFDHQRNTGFPLTGRHTKVACGRCHYRVRPRGGRRVVLYRLPRKGCGGCHATPHGGAAARARARRSPNVMAAILKKSAGRLPEARLEDCGKCHTTDGWRALRRPDAFDHGSVGYPLVGRHRGGDCKGCHRPGKRPQRRCGACHRDRHDGRLGSRCAECHRPLSWKVPGALERHRRTRLPLTASHALADCTACHPADRQAAYRGIPVTCAGCHIDRYNDPATQPDHRKANYGTRCEQCHRPVGWSPAFFAHKKFPLIGKHVGVACDKCHRRTPTPRTCFGCHAADRSRARSPDHLAPGFSTQCERCHTPNGWKPANFPDHDRLFPLNSGKHRGLTCADCHTDPTNYKNYNCLAPCHTRSRMDDKHKEIAGYLYESRACKRCHPRGEKN